MTNSLATLFLAAVLLARFASAEYPVVYPFPPRDVAASVTADGAVRLTWNNDPRNPQVGQWRIFRDFVPIAESPSEKLEFTDQTPSPGETAQYSVRAVAADGRESPLTGIYAIIGMSPEKEDLSGVERLLDYPFVSGLCLQVKWVEVEPELGKYAFERLDKILDAAAKRHKKVGIFFRKYLAGLPKGLDGKVQMLPPAEDAPRKASDRTPLSPEPYPLDAALDAAWKKFLEEFARRHDGNVAIHYVTLLGPGEHHMALPISRVMGPEGEEQRKGQFALMEKLGFSMERYVAAWRETVDFYAQVFPNTPWAYDITTQTGLGSANVQKPAEYGIRKYGTCLFIFTENLNGFDWWLGAQPGLSESKTYGVWGNNRAGILKLAEHTILGWQMFIRSWGMEPYDPAEYLGQDKGRAGPMNKALDNGLSTGAYWLEVWQSDCNKAPYQPMLTEAMARMGHVRVTAR